MILPLPVESIKTPQNIDKRHKDDHHNGNRSGRSSELLASHGVSHGKADYSRHQKVHPCTNTASLPAMIALFSHESEANMTGGEAEKEQDWMIIIGIPTKVGNPPSSVEVAGIGGRVALFFVEFIWDERVVSLERQTLHPNTTSTEILICQHHASGEKVKSPF